MQNIIVICMQRVATHGKLYTSLKPKHTVFLHLIQIDFAAKNNTYHSRQFQCWQQAKHFLLIYYFEIFLILC